MHDPCARTPNHTKFSINHTRLLVQRVLDFLDEQLACPTYSPDAKHFLEWAQEQAGDHIDRLAAAHLRAADTAAMDSRHAQRRFLALEREIANIREDFHEIHYLARIASGTSAFDVPCPVVLSIADLLRGLTWERRREEGRARHA